MPEILFRAMNAAVGNQDVACILSFFLGRLQLWKWKSMNYHVWNPPVYLLISFHKREDIEEMAAHLETGKRITYSVVPAVKVL